MTKLISAVRALTDILRTGENLFSSRTRISNHDAVVISPKFQFRRS